MQRKLGLEIGVNVSKENPWKQIERNMLLDYLPDDISSSQDVKEFRSKLCDSPDNEFVLVGYGAALFDQEEIDTFLFYPPSKSVEDSIVYIIKHLEAFERYRATKAVHKYPKHWQTLGSGKEVDLQVELQPKDKMEVEVQRLCGTKQSYESLEFRFAEDVRDGYVELLSKRGKINFVMRQRVSVGIQCAAQRIDSEQQTNPTFPANSWSQYFYELPERE